MKNEGLISTKSSGNEMQDIGPARIDAAARDADDVITKVSSYLEVDFTPQEQRKIIRRIDRRLVITVGVMYCISLMDRTNMSAANIAGMKVELQLEGSRYVSVEYFHAVSWLLSA